MQEALDVGNRRIIKGKQGGQEQGTTQTEK